MGVKILWEVSAPYRKNAAERSARMECSLSPAPVRPVFLIFASRTMRFAFLSAFPPFRGGIAQFSAALVRELRKDHAVAAFTFTRQYPDLLFPGTSQFDTTTPDGTGAVRVLDSISPLSWGRTAEAMLEGGAEIAVLRYWMPFFAPALGVVAGRLRSQGVPVVCIVDNAIPHEPRFYDRLFTKWFVGRCDGYVALTEAVAADIRSLRPDAQVLVLKHPLYDHFGAPMPMAEARKQLDVPADARVLLFFGLIRDYKGLDILLEAFADMDERYHLVIAGEPYGDMAPYTERIARLPDPSRVHLQARYITDAEVPAFFCAADAVVLPYRSGTQSGITAIAQHFGVPVLATDVGGLKEAIEHERTGLVIPEPSPDAVRAACELYFTNDRPVRFREALAKLREDLSWSRFAAEFVAFCASLRRP
jgi:glycosyltransferase involved in cell wall biosynthesis